MSTLSDLLAGVRKVILLEQNVALMQAQVKNVGDDLRRIRDHVDTIDKRVVRIETMIEMSQRSAQPPRIEG